MKQVKILKTLITAVGIATFIAGCSKDKAATDREYPSMVVAASAAPQTMQRGDKRVNIYG